MEITSKKIIVNKPFSLKIRTGTGNSVISAGFIAHYLIVIIHGAILGIIIASVESLGLTNGRRATGIGLLYVAIVWLIVFLPTKIYGFPPIMMNMMGPTVAGMLPIALDIAFIEHLLYGISMGALIFVVTRTEHTSPSKCCACAT